ncbi:MAG: hypothetical protein CM1200mP6_05430 [Anaerolineaceae bacterium]|nr:MAG: hypothetical protein CM1200mP6_05430 [Anaerolineaceae bacterium]
MHDKRIIPDKTPLGIYSIHLKRYEFAKTYMKGKLILDVACGVGYGHVIFLMQEIFRNRG